MEGPAECAEAAETDVEANIRYAPIRSTQEKHSALDAPALEITMRRLAERRAESADEVRFGYFRNSGEPLNAERLRKRAIHCISRPQHPTIALFHWKTHKPTLYAARPGGQSDTPRLKLWDVRSSGCRH
jgi:hypothetical protein